MSYVETEEQQMLRRQVREIGRKYGQEYYMEKARTGASPNELWACLLYTSDAADEVVPV